MLLTNPLFAAGTGLLAASGPSLSPTNPWAGISQGLLAAQQAKAYEQDMQANMMRMEMLKAQQEKERERDALLAQYGPAAQAFPDQFAQKFFAEEEKPSVWITGPDGKPALVTPTQAAELSQQGATPYEAPPAPPNAARLAIEAGLTPGTPEYQEFVRNAAVKPTTTVVNNVGNGPKLPAGYMWVNPEDPAQGVVPIPGGPGEKLTEAQSSAAGYAQRMEAAESIMNNIETSGYNAANFRDQYLPGMLQSEEGQMYRQAQEDWVRAKLRKESGAVIGDEEMEREIRTYFPRPGNGKKVREQKARARREAISAINISADARRKGAASGAPAQIQSDADYDSLPSGATFIAPDGSVRRKP